MNEKSRIKFKDIRNKKLVEGEKYDFGNCVLMVVAVQERPDGVWVKTQDCEALFDNSTGELEMIITVEDDVA